MCLIDNILLISIGVHNVFLIFSIQLYFLNFKFIIQISHSLRKIIMIINTHYKITIDVTQISNKHIEIHRHVDFILT